MSSEVKRRKEKKREEKKKKKRKEKKRKEKKRNKKRSAICSCTILHLTVELHIHYDR